MKLKDSMFFKASAILMIILISMFLFSGCLADETASYFEPDTGTVDGESATLIVTGSGSYTVIPDRVLVNVTIFSEEDTSKEAVNSNSTITEKVITELESIGIADIKIQTASFNLNPLYNYRRENEPPEVYAYRATTILEVSTTEILSIGEILARAIEAGSNDISSLRFDLSEELEKEAKTAALDEAAGDAKNKAYSITDSLGLEIDGIYNIQELETYYAGPVITRDFATEEADGIGEIESLPVSPNEIEVTASLQITYTLN
jgi:uncharacterized protein YggE